MDNQQLHWHKCFAGYQKALNNLSDGVKFTAERDLSGIESAGIIRSFQATYYMARATLKTLYIHWGEQEFDLEGEPFFRRVAEDNLISDSAIWLQMHQRYIDRNEGWNDDVSQSISSAVRERYYGELEKFRDNVERQFQV